MSLQIELNRLNANPTGEWLKGPRISFENVNRGTGPMERVTADEWFGRTGKTTGNPAAGQSPKVAQPPTVAHVMRFGKYKGRLMADVQDEDPGYWSWAIRECNGFAAQAKKAGLTDDEN